MSERKRIRKRIAGLEQNIQKHLKKISEEKAKPAPDQRLIAYWEKEIRSREQQIERLRRRLSS